MKSSLLTLAASLACLATTATSLAAEPVSLTSGAYRVSDGRYLYFSSNQPFLSRAFYPGEPGGDNNRDGSLVAGGIATENVEGSWISFASGELTNGNAGDWVTGWRNQVNADRYVYILFDLGATYALSSVDLRLTSQTGYRWSADENAHSVWFATELSNTPGTGVALDASSSFWAQSVTFSTPSDFNSSISLSFEQEARYLLLRLKAGTVDSSNAGGVIREVTIYGSPSPIPEPGSFALTAGTAALAGTLIVRGRHHR